MAKVYSNGQELGGKVRVDCLLHIAGQGITCQGMREIEPRMEEAFISLISRQMRSAR